MMMEVIDSNSKLGMAILSALGDKEMRRILDCAIDEAKSIPDIIKETSMPHATAYRKVKWMLEEKLMVVERIHITDDGKKFSIVRSTLKCRLPL